MDISFKSVVKQMVDQLYKEGVLDEPFVAVEALIDDVIFKKQAIGVSGFDPNKVDKGIQVHVPGQKLPSLTTPTVNPIKSVPPAPPFPSNAMSGSSPGAKRTPKVLQSPARVGQSPPKPPKPLAPIK